MAIETDEIHICNDQIQDLLCSHLTMGIDCTLLDVFTHRFLKKHRFTKCNLFLSCGKRIIHVLHYNFLINKDGKMREIAHRHSRVFKLLIFFHKNYDTLNIVHLSTKAMRPFSNESLCFCRNLCKNQRSQSVVIRLHQQSRSLHAFCFGESQRYNLYPVQ